MSDDVGARQSPPTPLEARSPSLVVGPHRSWDSFRQNTGLRRWTSPLSGDPVYRLHSLLPDLRSRAQGVHQRCVSEPLQIPAATNLDDPDPSKPNTSLPWDGNLIAVLLQIPRYSYKSSEQLSRFKGVPAAHLEGEPIAVATPIPPPVLEPPKVDMSPAPDQWLVPPQVVNPLPDDVIKVASADCLLPMPDYGDEELVDGEDSPYLQAYDQDEVEGFEQLDMEKSSNS